MKSTTTSSDGAVIGAKALREQLRSVAIRALPGGSQARQIAEKVSSGADYLRGKDDFSRASDELRTLPDSDAAGDIRIRRADGTATAAGSIVTAWSQASADRRSLFDGLGTDGQTTILIVDVRGIEAQALWRDDENGEPALVKGGSDAAVTLFETAPNLVASKRPDAQNGVLQNLRGEKVSIKRRGNTSRWDQKPNLSIGLDDDEISGFPKQLNLNNCIRDPSYQRIRLAWALLEEARCPVQPCTYAELTLNGIYQGTYVALAPMDQYYFRTWFPTAQERAIFRGQYGDIAGGATLEFRGKAGRDYYTTSRKEGRTYEPRLGTPDSDYEKLAQFIDTLHHSASPSDPAFAQAMEGLFDVATFLRVMAVINLLGSWDAYYLNAQNYFLHVATVKAGTPPRISFCPYDQDSVLGVSWPGQERNWQEKDVLFRGKEIGKLPLLLRLLENPRFRSYYLDFMTWFVHQRFTTERLQAKRAAFWKVLEKSVYLEAASPQGATSTHRPWTNDQIYRHAITNQQFDVTTGALSGLQVLGIQGFIEARRARVLSQLKAEPCGQSRIDFDSEDWALR